MLADLFVIFFWFFRVFVAIAGALFICVFLHEMGHAIPMLLFSKKKVEIYIGSHGQPVPGIKFKIGRVLFFISRNPLRWLNGMCKPGEAFSIDQQIIYVISGPIATILLAICSYVMMINHEQHGFNYWLLKLIFLVSLSQSVGLLFPWKNNDPQKSIGGNDTYETMKLLRWRRLPQEFFQIKPLIDEGKLEEATKLFETKIEGRSRSRDVYRTGIYLYLKNYEFQKAHKLDEELARRTKFEIHDFINSSHVHTMLGNHVLAIDRARQALILDPNNNFALINLSYALIQANDYNGAIKHSNHALGLNPNCAASLDNRGMARLRTGLLEEARSDLEASIAIDDSQAETHRNLGSYYLLKGQFHQALALFEKAQEIDPNTNHINEYIAEAKSKMNI